jgi:hypothetical protein
MFISTQLVVPEYYTEQFRDRNSVEHDLEFLYACSRYLLAISPKHVIRPRAKRSTGLCVNASTCWMACSRMFCRDGSLRPLPQLQSVNKAAELVHCLPKITKQLYCLVVRVHIALYYHFLTFF